MMKTSIVQNAEQNFCDFMQNGFFEEEQNQQQQIQQQFQTIEEKQKKMKKYNRKNQSIGFAIFTIVILLLLIFLSLPWWKYNVDVDTPSGYATPDVKDAYAETWYLDKVELKRKNITFGSPTVKETTYTIYYHNYTTENITFNPVKLYDDRIATYKNTYTFMIIVIIITIVSIVFFALNFEMLRKPTIIISILSFVIALALPLYIAITFPPAMDKDIRDMGTIWIDREDGWNKGFAGSKDTKIPIEIDEKGKVVKEATINEKYSPTFGWLLALLPFFTNLLASIFFIKPDTKFTRKAIDWHVVGKKKKIDATKVQTTSTVLGEGATEKLFSKEEQERLYYEKVQQFPQPQYYQPQYQKEISPLKRRIPDSGVRSARDIFRKEEDVFQQPQPVPQQPIQEKKSWFGRKKEQTQPQNQPYQQMQYPQQTFQQQPQFYSPQDEKKKKKEEEFSEYFEEVQ